MKITAINGSPKADGISALIIKQMEKLLDEQITIHSALKLVHAKTPQETLSGILEADILLIVLPLFVDSFPTPLIELLTRLESAVNLDSAMPQVYAIANGAFDASQTALSLEMVEHFTCRSGLPWGYGVGIGAGSMIYSAGDNWQNGPASDIYKALCDMATAINKKRSGENIYVSPKFPRFLYEAVANIRFWLEAKHNRTCNLRARPYTKQ